MNKEVVSGADWKEFGLSVVIIQANNIWAQVKRCYVKKINLFVRGIKKN